MAKKLYVQLQTPTIELPVKAQDSGKNSATVLVGFKRYNTEITDVKLQEFQKLLEAHLNLLKKREETTEEVDQSDITECVDRVNSFIKTQVVYVKKAKLEVMDDETSEKTELVIQDTRKAKPVEDFWDSPESCLDALLDMYLESAPWKSSFISSLQAALLNANYEEDKLKN